MQKSNGDAAAVEGRGVMIRLLYPLRIPVPWREGRDGASALPRRGAEGAPLYGTPAALRLPSLRCALDSALDMGRWRRTAGFGSPGHSATGAQQSSLYERATCHGVSRCG